jgi:hypothetical protein
MTEIELSLSIADALMDPGENYSCAIGVPPMEYRENADREPTFEDRT